jgi:hypothetical protein
MVLFAPQAKISNTYALHQAKFAFVWGRVVSGPLIALLELHADS